VISVSRCVVFIVISLGIVGAQSSLPGKPYSAPRTPWGDPDLQGMWPGNVSAPLQRPAEFGERDTLTDAEFAQREAQAKAQAAADSQQYVAASVPAGRAGGRGGPPSPSATAGQAGRGRAGGGIGPPDHWLERGTPIRQTSLIVDPPNGRLPALAAGAEERRKQARGGRGLPGEWRGTADSYDDLNIYYRCVTRGLLGSVIPVIYGNGNEIVQAPGTVVFRNEMIHESRVIPLDPSTGSGSPRAQSRGGGRPHVSPAIRMYMGDSRGRWEGDTLVVETTNFTDKVAIGSNGAGYPGDPGYHSLALRVVERFTRTSDTVLTYEVTVDDPQTWVKPWTLRIPLMRGSDPHLFEYACHEGNYAMRNILSASRSEDKK
jgi:hypothetical protein